MEGTRLVKKRGKDGWRVGKACTPEGLETAFIEMSNKDLDLRYFLPGLVEAEFQSCGSVVAVPMVTRALNLESPVGHIHDVFPLVSVCHACVSKADLIRDRVARL